MSKRLPTPQEAKENLLAQPGIDVTRQKPGTEVLVETDDGLYELTITNPQRGIVEISGSDPRLKLPVSGRFLHSFSALDSKVRIANWIGKAMKMVIAFQNCRFESGTVMAATISGKDWHYDVF